MSTKRRKGWTKKVTVVTRKPPREKTDGSAKYTVVHRGVEFTGTARAILIHFGMSARHFDALCYRLQTGVRNVADLKAPTAAQRHVRTFKGETSNYRGEGYEEHATGRGSATLPDADSGEEPDA